MIPIKELEKEKLDSLYSELIEIKPKQHNKIAYETGLYNINTWCWKNVIIKGKHYDFKDIILANYNELKCIKEYLEINQIKLPATQTSFIIKKLYEQRFPKKSFVDRLEVTVCPYCNRSFINSTKQRTMCELDHIFNKKTYPILAVSFNNLVPVCHVCNHAKGCKDISCSPYESYNIDDFLEFTYNILDYDYLTNKNSISIEMKYDTAKLKKNVEAFKLDEVYQIHKDIVQEYLKKAMIFNPTYISNLYETYEGVFESKEELLKIVFGNEILEKNYGKRPLSKMTTDILDELLWEYYSIDISDIYN